MAQQDASETHPPPRILIVMPAQWTRALIRAALRAAGYDAVGATGIREALQVPPREPDRGPVGLLVVDQLALVGGTRLLETLLTRHNRPETILIARATVGAPEGPWRHVLQRPVSVADVVAAVEEALPLPSEQRHAID
jgi:CheY-like chemotaxis protein